MEFETYTIMSVANDDDDEYMSLSNQLTSWFVLIFVFAWVVAGIVAFLWSIMCFGKSGTMSQQLVGLFLAIFFGPLYWLYLYSVKKYCR